MSSCAKLGYLIDQGKGQWQLISQGRKNSDVLSDPQVSEEHKQKIRLIARYKDYFYKYFGREPSEIYDETTFLGRDAVTYLVIASPYNEIKAVQECFPIMGCFPYLGFFSQKKASEHESSLVKKGLITYQRPVLAYSTLGYLDDNILSTFFSYSEKGLAELIFHELFHTVFFIKNEVDLNENLATYFAQRMMEEYFAYSTEDLTKNDAKRKKLQKVNLYIVEKVADLNKKYKEADPKTMEEAQKIFDQFMLMDFVPQAKKLCDSLKLSYCYPVERKWNNASLTAFLTYQNKLEKIRLYHQRQGMGLRDLLADLEKNYEKYEDDHKGFDSFSDYLWSLP